MRSTSVFFSFLIPFIAADCVDFSTNGLWERQYAYYPVYQVSDYITCVNSSQQDSGSCGGGFCALSVNAGLSLYATYNITPVVPEDSEQLERFFGVVKNAVSKNEGFEVTSEPEFEFCGGLAQHYGKIGQNTDFCIRNGDDGWVRFYPMYYCVGGIPDNCIDGPFENGVPISVCGIRYITDGKLDLVPQRTYDTGGFVYRAQVQNPFVDNGSTCEASAGVPGFEADRKKLLHAVLGAIFTMMFFV